MNVLKIFRRNSKKMLVSAEARVELARGKVGEAFVMFQQAQDAIDESNNELLQAATEAAANEESFKDKARSEEKIKQRALVEIETNKKLSEQLKPFLQ